MSRLKVFSIKNSAAFALVGAAAAVLMVGGCGGNDGGGNPAGGGNGTDGGTLTFGGQSYRTIKVGGKRWMAENLNYVTPDNETDSSWCYDNSPDNCTKYGRLYNWDAAMKACPAKWRLPNNADWSSLTKAIAGVSPGGNGEKLKSTTGWSDKYDGSSGNGTDEFGFSALPGGGYYYGNTFQDVGKYGYFWSATEDVVKDGACFLEICYTSVNTHIYSYPRYYGFSVRCVQD